MAVVFYPISEDLGAYQLFEVFFDDRPHTLLGSSDISPQCNEDGLPISYELSAGDINKDSDRVGELKRFCIRSTWSELTRFLTGGTWSNREENSSLEREGLVTCVDHTIQFHTYVRFEVKDLYGTVGTEGVKIEFTIHSRTFISNGRIDADGVVFSDIVLPDVAPGTLELELVVERIIQDDNIDGKFNNVPHPDDMR